MAGSLRDGDEEVASFFAFQDVITAVLGILILIALQLALTMNVTMAEQGNQAPPSDTDLFVPKETITQLEQELESLENRFESIESDNRDLGRQIKTFAEAPSPEVLKKQMALVSSELIDLKRQLRELETVKDQMIAALRQQARKLGVGKTQTEIEEMDEEIKEMEIQLASLEENLKKGNEKTKDLEGDLEKIRSKKNLIWLIPDHKSNGKQPVLITVTGTRMRFEMFDKPESLANYSTEKLTSSFEKAIENYSTTTHQLNFLFKPSGAKYFDLLRNLSKKHGFDIGYDPIAESTEILFSTP